MIHSQGEYIIYHLCANYAFDTDKQAQMTKWNEWDDERVPQRDDNYPDLPELEENTHRRARTSGTSGMMNDMTNTLPMWQTCSWCDKHGPDIMRTPTGGNEQDDKCVPWWDDDDPDLPELKENPHMRARTSRTPPPYLLTHTPL